MKNWIKDVVVVIEKRNAGASPETKPTVFLYLVSSDGARLKTADGKYLAVKEE